MNLNDYRGEIAAVLANAGEPEKYRRTPPPERAAYYWQTLTDALLASPALAQLLAAARDEARAEVAHEIATSVSYGAELRYDGSEDPGMAAYVQGLGDAVQIARGGTR